MRRPDRRIFFGGDTAYGRFFEDIRQRLGPIDLALLPIGAYEPRWFMQAVHRASRFWAIRPPQPPAFAQHPVRCL